MYLRTAVCSGCVRRASAAETRGLAAHVEVGVLVSAAGQGKEERASMKRRKVVRSVGLVFGRAGDAIAPD